MKSYTIIKIGYTTDTYGCSGEYFSCFYTKKGEIKSFVFEGMYGVKSRVAHAMEKKGYEKTHCTQIYGKLTRSDIPRKQVLSEYEVYKDGSDTLLIKL